MHGDGWSWALSNAYIQRMNDIEKWPIPIHRTIDPTAKSAMTNNVQCFVCPVLAVSGQPLPDRAHHGDGHLRLQGARGGGAQGGHLPQHGAVREGGMVMVIMIVMMVMMMVIMIMMMLLARCRQAPRRWTGCRRGRAAAGWRSTRTGHTPRSHQHWPHCSWSSRQSFVFSVKVWFSVGAGTRGPAAAQLLRRNHQRGEY